MRFAALAFLLLTSTAFSATDVPALQVVRLWPGYRTAESFERISEYFTGKENPGRQTILRSQLTARGGYYFLVRLENLGTAQSGATLELQVIAPTSPEPRTFTFKAEIPAGSRVFNVGLTGSDWPDPKAHPVAWLFTVRAADGTELTRQQSFLWAKPETSSPPSS